MDLTKFLYQLRKKGNELYIARLNLSINSPLQLKKLEEDEWKEVSPWDVDAGSTVPCTEWLEQNKMKNHLYMNGIKNYLL